MPSISELLSPLVSSVFGTWLRIFVAFFPFFGGVPRKVNYDYHSSVHHQLSYPYNLNLNGKINTIMPFRQAEEKISPAFV